MAQTTLTTEELNEYVNNTYETQKKWRKILDPRKTY